MSDTGDGIKRSADFSPCRTWRYTLIREWGPLLPRLLFVLLNPSTADETHDDPTNTRGMGFARSWGFGTCVFVNLFAIRSPKPVAILEAEDPIGPDNDRFILKEASKAKLIVCAWGVHGTHDARDDHVLKLLKHRELWCLGKTKRGHPKHPLYLHRDTQREPFANCGYRVT